MYFIICVKLLFTSGLHFSSPKIGRFFRQGETKSASCVAQNLSRQENRLHVHILQLMPRVRSTYICTT